MSKPNDYATWAALAEMWNGIDSDVTELADRFHKALDAFKANQVMADARYEFVLRQQASVILLQAEEIGTMRQRLSMLEAKLGLLTWPADTPGLLAKSN